MGTVVLTSAQLAESIASYTVVGLEAPGTGKAWDVVSAVARRNGGSGGLTTSTLVVNAAGGIGSMFNFNENIMGGTVSFIAKADPVPASSATWSNLVENADIQVTTQIDDLTGGAQDFTVKIYVTAYLIDVS
jgi:hypothetical protein